MILEKFFTTEDVEIMDMAIKEYKNTTAWGHVDAEAFQEKLERLLWKLAIIESEIDHEVK